MGRAHNLGVEIRPARVGYCCGLAGLILLIGCQSLQNAVANGDTRTISMHHLHTGEDITITYKRDGRDDDEALKKLNWFLRDWRRDEPTRMHPRLIDLLWEVHREVDAKGPINIVSAYRSPQTNAMLRRRSNGVAELSHHMGGNAIDFFIPDVPLEKLRVIGLRLQRGGVGYYPTSGSPFVHMDVGSVRHWPRMTHDQLARVFPDGRTVHIPSDGKPLARYALALADIERRGNHPSAPSLAAARTAGALNTEMALAEPAGQSRNFLAALFGRGDTGAASDDRTASTTPRKASVTRTASISDKATETVAVLPPARPGNYQMASVLPVPLPRPVHRPAATLAAVTPNDVVGTRGYWQGLPESDPTALALSARLNPGPRNDRAPVELALAYAAHPEVTTADRSLPMGQTASRAIGAAPAASAAGAPVRRSTSRPPAAPFALAAASSAAATQVGERIDNPWLRAMLVAPSVQNVMSVTLLGPPDYSRLSPMLQKPPISVMMTFSADPHLGMTAQRFSGEAVVFVSTVTFAPRQTAALH